MSELVDVGVALVGQTFPLAVNIHPECSGRLDRILAELPDSVQTFIGTPEISRVVVKRSKNGMANRLERSGIPADFGITERSDFPARLLRRITLRQSGIRGDMRRNLKPVNMRPLFQNQVHFPETADPAGICRP